MKQWFRRPDWAAIIGSGGIVVTLILGGASPIAYPARASADSGAKIVATAHDVEAGCGGTPPSQFSVTPVSTTLSTRASRLYVMCKDGSIVQVGSDF